MLSACGGKSGEKPRSSSASAEARSAAETTEPTEVAEQAKPAAPAVAPLPPAPDPPGELAYAHWDAASQAGRAIMQGDLATAAPHLAWLGHYQYPSKLPIPWQPYAARVQLAARVLARATTVGEAVRALPTLDAACGACHASLAGNDFNATEGPVGHGEGAYALLQGLGGPADKVFERAASAVQRVEGKADPEALKALRSASARAKQATTWPERLAATEEIYGQCGACHEKLR